MLKLFYDTDTDYLEVFLEKTPNYGDDVTKSIIAFKSEKDDSIVGYGIYKPQKAVLNFKELNPKTKIAIFCFMKRKKLGLTEKELAKKLTLSYRTYQRIEEGEISKIDDFIKIQHFLKDIDLSQIFKAS